MKDFNKIAIISDLHLGKRMFRTENDSINKYENEGYKQFERFIDQILNKNPEAVVIPGDIFDEPNPNSLPISVFTKQINRLLNNDIKIICIPGNHEFSFKNRNNNVHCLSNIINIFENENIIHSEYEIKSYETENQLYVLVPFLYQNEESNKELWKDVAQLCNSKNKKQNILVTHGCHESANIMNEGYSNDFTIPDVINEYFDLELIGHIHAPFEITKKTNRGICKIISPGASILFDSTSEVTSPLFIDMNDKFKNSKENIESVRTLKINCDKNTINKILEEVKNNIYIVDFFGDIGDIDENTYINALKKAINIQINVKSQDQESKTIEKIGSFWDFIDEKYPGYKNIFNNIREKITSEERRI